MAQSRGAVKLSDNIDYPANKLLKTFTLENGLRYLRNLAFCLLFASIKIRVN